MTSTTPEPFEGQVVDGERVRMDASTLPDDVGNTPIPRWLQCGATAKSGKFYPLRIEARAHLKASNLAVIQRAALESTVTTKERVRQKRSISPMRERMAPARVCLIPGSETNEPWGSSFS